MTDPNNPYGVVMRNGCIVAAIEQLPPYTFYNEEEDKFTGTCVSIFQWLMETMGFCYVFIRSPNGLWGHWSENGSWDGLVGLLQREEAEIVVCPVVQTHKRYQAIDYSASVQGTDYTIAYPRPKLKANVLGLVLPFSYKVWLGILLICLFLTLIAMCLNKYYFSRITEIVRTRDMEAHEAHLPQEMFFLSLVGQPCEKNPEQHSSRFILVVWLLMVLTLHLTYKCNLKAQLIVPSVSLPFDDLDGLVNQDEIPWSFLEGSVIPQYFKPAFEEDPNSVMGRGWKNKGELYTNAVQVPDFIFNKKMACITISETVHYFFSDDFSKVGKCRIAAAKKTLIKIDISFGMKKGSKIREKMDKLILNMLAYGIIQNRFHQDKANATYCFVPPGEEVGIKLRALSIDDFIGTFFIYSMGNLMGIISFLVERSKKKCSCC